VLKFTLNLALVPGGGPRTLFEGSPGHPFLLLGAPGQFEGLEKGTQFETPKYHDEYSGGPRGRDTQNRIQSHDFRKGGPPSGPFWEGICRTGFGTFPLENVKLCSSFLVRGLVSGSLFEGSPGHPFLVSRAPGEFEGSLRGVPF
jgi:hypothetical protein